MKVIKRDGRAVDYDRAKIETAITKANEDVKRFLENITNQITSIVSYKTENMFNTSLSFGLLIIKLSDNDIIKNTK